MLQSFVWLQICYVSKWYESEQMILTFEVISKDSFNQSHLHLAQLVKQGKRILSNDCCTNLLDQSMIIFLHCLNPFL